MSASVEETTAILEQEGQPNDPGALEGSRKDPRLEQDKLTPDHPRFKEVYAKMKQFEEMVKKMEDEKESTKALIESMKEHNAQLAKALEDGMDKVASAVGSKDAVDELDGYEAQLKALRESKKTAKEQLDFDLEIEIDEKILEVRDKIKELKSGSKTGTQAKITQDDQKVINKWISTTEWYNEDPIMRAAAIEIDRILTYDPKWSGRSLSERLAEVKDRVEKRFNYTNESSKNDPRPAVESGRHSPPPSATSVKLTSEQEELIKGLGISREAYIKQLSLVKGRVK